MATDGNKNRDHLMARIAARMDGFGRSLTRHAGRMPAPAQRAEVHRIGVALQETAREVLWIAAGKLDEPRVRRLDLVAVVRDVVDTMNTRAPKGAPRITVSAVPAKVVGRWDRMHIDVILGELLSNARKHGGGKPVKVTVSGDEARHGMILSVENAARSVENAPLPRRPFRRFVRGPGARGEGMGVGLWLVDAIARQNGGRLTFARTSSGVEARVFLALTPPT